MTVEFQKFKVFDFFDIHPTKSYKLTNQKLMNDAGTTPVLTNTATNNGIGGWSTLPATETGPMITFSDTTTGPNTLFVQTTPFIGYSHVQALYSKIDHEWNELELLYMVVAIKAGAGTGWSYSTKFNRKLVANFDIELPVTEDNKPNFEYMAQFIHQLELQHIQQLEDQRTSELNTYLKITGLNNTDLTTNDQQVLNQTVTWQKFKINQLFDVHPTKAYNLTNKQLMDEQGTTPVLTNTSTDNGIGGWSKLEPTENQLMITFSDTTTGTNTIFVQTKPFIGYPHVQGLYSKIDHDWTAQELLYVATVMKAAAGTDWSYATKFTRKIVSNLDIMLPVTSNEEIDYAYMQNYIQAIEKQNIKRVTTYKNQIINEIKKLTNAN